MLNTKRTTLSLTIDNISALDATNIQFTDNLGGGIAFDVQIDETVQFGALQVTPRVCNTRPPTEPAQTTGFVEVDEITLHNEIRRLFTEPAPDRPAPR